MVCARTVMKKAQGQLHACRVFFSISGRMDMVLVLLESLKITMPHFESFGTLDNRQILIMKSDLILPMLQRPSSGSSHRKSNNKNTCVCIWCSTNGDNNREKSLRRKPSRRSSTISILVQKSAHHQRKHKKGHRP
ncbi:uncharacterized protein [Spinacia oleracea]|uniref:Uncharacterized protein n=1 Tax=Spinacia oleracea TaxID=3562 RepID=A0ABM3QIE4_SPIOL|nr:uncharacterized protein LOC130459659 [Spinacia oleracea]